MASYRDCKWCSGDGCNQCHYEREKAAKEFDENGPKPIFSMKINPDGKLDDPELAKSCIGYEAIKHAFGPHGDGVREVERNCAIASLMQLLKK